MALFVVFFAALLFLSIVLFAQVGAKKAMVKTDAAQLETGSRFPSENGGYAVLGQIMNSPGNYQSKSDERRSGGPYRPDYTVPFFLKKPLSVLMARDIGKMRAFVR
jgi:hypothetical protein